MKQYIYRPQDAGLTNWPQGELRLDGIEITENHAWADVFVCPGNIRIFEGTPGTGKLDIHKLNRLPYFRGNESRHAFFDCSDNFKAAVNLPIMFIRCDVRTWMLPHDVNTLPTPWPVEDYSDCIDVPDGGFKSDVSFHGWLSSDTRRKSAAACIANPEVRCDSASYPDFFGYLVKGTPEYERRRAAFKDSMRRSRCCLCPESIEGVLPYRFFESMSAGRVPLLVGSDYVLPFADEIDYSVFTLFCERDEAQNADKVAVKFCGQHNDKEITEMGQLARAAWVKWLDTSRWAELHAYAVTKHLAKMGVAA